MSRQSMRQWQRELVVECDDKTVESLKETEEIRQGIHNAIPLNIIKAFLRSVASRLKSNSPSLTSTHFRFLFLSLISNKFAQLSEEDKKTCAQYIFENGIYDIRSINEQFMRPLFDKINEHKNYIRLADKSDLELYNMAPRSLKEHIDYLDKMFILETKSDVDEFWSRTGIRNLAKNNISNETFVSELQRERCPRLIQDETISSRNPKNLRKEITDIQIR